MSDRAFFDSSVAFPSAQPTPAIELDQVTQARLDHLYWNTSTPVAVIARQLGLPTRVASFATPRPAGYHCYVCHTEFVHASRSAHTSTSPQRCRRCRTLRRPPGDDRWWIDPTELPSQRCVIAVSHSVDGLKIDDCIQALARIGKGWDERSLIVIHQGSQPAALGAALTAFPPGTLAIPSFRDLGLSQTERLQTLWAITKEGWRVVTAHDVGVEHSVNRWDIAHLDSDEYESTRWSAESSRPVTEPLLTRLLDETGNGWHANVVRIKRERE